MIFSIKQNMLKKFLSDLYNFWFITSYDLIQININNYTSEIVVDNF